MNEFGDEEISRPEGHGSSARATPGEFVSYYMGVAGQIEIALPQRSSRVIMLTGSILGEGNTDVTIGLGITIASEMGRKTAVVDCNLHHPEMHLRFGTPDVGLGEYLTGRIPLGQALANTVIPNLYTMPLGRGVASLSAFGNEKLERLISDLRRNFEYVLIDAAPVGVYPECVVLCNKIDGVILVVRYGSTRREIVRRAKQIVARADGRVLGVVLNRRKFPIPEFLYRKI